MNRGEIFLKNETLAPLKPYLLRRGIPLPPGAVKSADGARIVDDRGNVLPSVGKILQKRPDGSVEWMAMDILVNLGPQEEKSIFVEPKPATKTPKVANEVTVRESGKLVTLSNGISEVTVSRSGGPIIHKLVINGHTLIEPNSRVDLEVVDAGGKIHRASFAGAYKITVPDRNRLRTQVKVEGKHQARDGSKFMDFALRFTLTAGSPDLTLEHTFYCREPSDGKILVKSMRLVMPTTMNRAATKLVRQSHHGHNWAQRPMEIAENIEIVGSSVGNIDRYAVDLKGPGVSHQCAGGMIFLRNGESLHEDYSKVPFHMRPGQRSGFRADLQIAGMTQVSPIVGWKQKNFTLVTTFEHFRQLHPKSIEIDEDRIIYSIWPTWSTPMEMVQGVSKSHIFWITGEKRALNMDEVEECHHRWEYGYVEPVDVSFDPEWPAFCEVLECQHILKHQPMKYPLLENLIEPVPSAGNPGRHTYDRQSAIGMFHFGDGAVSADASHCMNNEDDMTVFFPLQHFLRTGQTYAWDYGKEAARHYMEVDFCEWSTDPRQRGGLIPHTGQHFIGNVYPSHQWSEGILAYYYMSGDERARNVVLSVAENHCWWTYNETGIITADGREAGVPLINLACAYRLNPDPKYIKAAKHIIKHFFLKYTKKDGTFEYPYPQGYAKNPHKYITGYGDWSSFAGLYRLWEVTGEEEFRKLGVKLLKQAIKPGSFTLNDVRGMDFLAAWALGRMTGDMDSVIQLVESAIPMLLRRGGHPLRRMNFLKELDERGLIDDKMVGNRAGAI